MFCLGVLQFLPHSTLWLQIVSAFFFLLTLTRAVRWGKNSGTRARMILREMEVCVGTQTNSRELPVVASLYLFVLFRFRAIRVTTRYFFLTFYLALCYPGKSNLRFSPWNPGISLHRTFFFFFAFRQEPLGLLVPCLHIRIDTICRECSWFKILVTAQNKTQEQLNKTKQQRINQGWSYHCL